MSHRQSASTRGPGYVFQARRRVQPTTRWILKRKLGNVKGPAGDSGALMDMVIP